MCGNRLLSAHGATTVAAASAAVPTLPSSALPLAPTPSQHLHLPTKCGTGAAVMKLTLPAGQHGPMACLDHDHKLERQDAHASTGAGAGAGWCEPSPVTSGSSQPPTLQPPSKRSHSPTDTYVNAPAPAPGTLHPHSSSRAHDNHTGNIETRHKHSSPHPHHSTSITCVPSTNLQNPEGLVGSSLILSL